MVDAVEAHKSARVGQTRLPLPAHSRRPSSGRRGSRRGQRCEVAVPGERLLAVAFWRCAGGGRDVD